MTKCQDEIGQVVGHKSGYCLKPTRYSYKKLLQVKEHIDDLFENKKNKDILSNITGYLVNDQDNLIIVELQDLNEKYIEEFKKSVSDFDMIVFKHGEFAVDDTSGGRLINADGRNSTFSFRARRSGVNGFVVSGHAARNAGGNGTIFRVNSTNMGSVEIWRQEGNLDSAFCRANSVIVLNNTIWQNGLIIPTVAGVVAQNTTVYMAGGNSGVRSGVVGNANATSTLNGITLNGVRANYSRQNGDSGGPVYRRSGVEARLVGIHSRGYSSAPTGFFVRSSSTLQSFNLSVW